MSLEVFVRYSIKKVFVKNIIRAGVSTQHISVSSTIQSMISLQIVIVTMAMVMITMMTVMISLVYMVARDGNDGAFLSGCVKILATV